MGTEASELKCVNSHRSLLLPFVGLTAVTQLYMASGRTLQEGYR